MALIYALWARAVVTAYGWVAGEGRTANPAPGLTPGAVYVLLISVLGMALGAMLSARLLHRRKLGSLFGPSATVLRDFLVTAALVCVVQGMALGLWSIGYDAEPNLDVSTWLLLLPLSLLAILIQAGAEEVTFRGYLQQQFAARFRSPFIWMLAPSLVFGIAHFSPLLSGGNQWLFVLSATCFGLAAADLTARTGSIGAAWGFHFANNMAALLFVGFKDMVPGLALFVTPFGAEDQHGRSMILFALLTLGVAWLLVRVVLRR